MGRLVYGGDCDMRGGGKGTGCLEILHLLKGCRKLKRVDKPCFNLQHGCHTFYGDRCTLTSQAMHFTGLCERMLCLLL